MPFCYKCGTQIPDENASCPKCGEKQQLIAPVEAVVQVAPKKTKRYAIYMFIIAAALIFSGLSFFAGKLSAAHIGFLIFSVPLILMGIAQVKPKPAGAKWISSPLNKAALIAFAVFVIYVPASIVVSSNLSKTGNIFIDAKVQIVEMDNGYEWQGRRAYIRVDKEAARKATEEDFAEFIKKDVANKTYNWFTVDFGDGTGIVFTGCLWYAGEYGKIDKDGSLIDSYGTLTVRDFDNYIIAYKVF